MLHKGFASCQMPRRQQRKRKKSPVGLRESRPGSFSREKLALPVVGYQRPPYFGDTSLRFTGSRVSFDRLVWPKGLRDVPRANWVDMSDLW